ncbi:hypothetical protein GUJ93_ZPchr0007g3808 [Zizania palustris]|uniref:Uncharacterized protein n=1 Tax=Zizania palustris TaxID=103762 RepID=A0A8J5W504_ZIZPA|nr:hypothetical protein GUJ93_ZPchr0007g3808 [Zizania palustris]
MPPVRLSLLASFLLPTFPNATLRVVVAVDGRPASRSAVGTGAQLLVFFLPPACFWLLPYNKLAVFYCYKRNKLTGQARGRGAAADAAVSLLLRFQVNKPGFGQLRTQCSSESRKEREDRSLQLATVAIIRMRDFASCLSQSVVQVAHSSSPGGQNMVQCAYLARLRGKSCRVTVTWSKMTMGQALAIAVDDSSNRCLCKTEIKPWLFSKRKGSKAMELDGGALDIIWDLSSAKFAAGPEPVEGFYVALVCDLEAVLVLGDMRKEVDHRVSSDALAPNAVMIARKEHIYGKKVYSAKARFLDIGQLHHITIECDTLGLKDPSLEIRIGKKRVMQVKRLAWKFRGNQTIYVDGLPVEVLWDVHDWLFGSSNGRAMFLFQSGRNMMTGLIPKKLSKYRLSLNHSFPSVDAPLSSTTLPMGVHEISRIAADTAELLHGRK